LTAEASDAPPGTSQRIRKRATWAVALFAACVVPAIVGIGITGATTEQVNIATPFALGFWVLGVLFAIAAAIPTLRHWDLLPQQTRWLGALPMLSVSLMLSVALVAAIFVRP
jgi:hypothetical protein